MGLEEDPHTPSDRPRSDHIFLVCHGRVLRLGLLRCTDWHFRVRHHLGYPVQESSFVQLLIGKTIGLQIDRQVADTLAVGVFTVIVIATAISWTVELRRQRQGERLHRTVFPDDRTRHPNR